MLFRKRIKCFCLGRTQLLAFYSFLIKLRQNNETGLGPAPWTGFRAQAKGSCLWGWDSGWEDRLSLAGLQVLRPKACGTIWGGVGGTTAAVLDGAGQPPVSTVCGLLSLSGVRSDPSASPSSLNLNLGSRTERRQLCNHT